jgi:hypothetical protein
MTSRGTVSAVFGQALPPVNIGRVNNKGYEIDVTYSDKIGQDFTFSVRGQYSVAKNKILFRDEPKPQFSYQALTGNSIGQILAYRVIGFYKDAADIAQSPTPNTPARPGDLKYADLNNDGAINGFDMEAAGYPNFPNTTYGFEFTLGYKGIFFNVLFQGARNFNVRGAAEAIRAFGSNLMEIHQQAWTPELGDNAQYPRLSHNGGLSDPLSYPSDFWLIRGDYLRVKTAELGYAFPETVARKIGANSLRIYTNGYNLFTWSKVSKRYEFDPEITSGTDRTNYPPHRMLNLGLSASF